MSVLADCIRAANRFIFDPTPQHALEWGTLHDQIVELDAAEKDQVAGGFPFVNMGGGDHIMPPMVNMGVGDPRICPFIMN